MPESIPLDEAGEVTLPVVETLTGRGFITGKSGSGKSSTASVIAEELLERGFPLLIVDTDGEYWGLKERYEVLHVGADDECDLQVGPEHAEKLAELALEENVPIILDVSGYLDEAEASALIRETVDDLFAREKKRQQPFLVIVEEVHEYIPEGGGLDDTGRVFVKVGKRGRKRGLGLVGISQRPADVKKDFITQANWLVWHRLTWENDTAVVRRVVSADHADAVSELGDGEAFLQTDFLEADVERVQVRRKHTFDAGATPDLEDFERPELKGISTDLVDELEEISQRQRERRDRIEQLEREVEAKEAEIEDLEAELDRARDVQALAEQMTDAMSAAASGGDAAAAETIKAEVMEVREAKRELESEYEAVVGERDELADRVAELEAELEERQAAEDLRRLRDELDELVDRHAEVLTVDGGDERLRDRIRRLEEENEALKRRADSSAVTVASEGDGALVGKVQHDAVQAAVDVAKQNSDYADEHFDRVISVLATADDGGPLTAAEVAPMTSVSEKSIGQVLKELFQSGILKREQERNGSYEYRLDEEFLDRRIEVAGLEA